MIKGFISSIFNHAGYQIIPSWRISSYDQSEFLQKVFTRYNVDLCVDVGANVGQYYDFLRLHVGYKGKIHSFEPQPECVMKLQERKKKDPLWFIEPIALGSQDTTLSLNIMHNSDFSSFRFPDTNSVPELTELNTVVDQCDVPVRRLDTLNIFTDTQDSSTSIFLKVDTQGFDLEVLEGASGFIESVVAIQTEASVLPIYKGTPTIVDTLQAMSKKGFSLAHATPVTRDTGLRTVEFDLVFINNHRAEKIAVPV